MLTGFHLLDKVASLDKYFISGAPWKGKEEVVIQCGYIRSESTGTIKPKFGEFHEAYEDARMFREMFAKELRESTEDPQEVFQAFSYVREESLFLDDVVEQIRALGIDYIFELREEILEHELANCSDPVDV